MNNKDLEPNEPKERPKQHAFVKLSAEFSGPLPHPSILAKYETIQKGSADRIIKMAEQQSEHRRDLERNIVGATIRYEYLGIWFAGILTIIFMGAGFYLILRDKTAIGFLAAFGPVVFHAGNYFTIRHRERKSKQ